MKFTVADLHLAVRSNQLVSIKRMLEAGVLDVNKPMRGITALSLAINLDLQQVIDLLLEEKNTDVSKVSRDHNDRLEPPLFTACRLGKILTVKKLLANSMTRIFQTDFYGHTPLWISVRECHLEIVQLLVDIGACLMYKETRASSQCPLYLITKNSFYGNPTCRVIAELLVRQGIYLDAADVKGRTPLYFAIKHGDSEFFQLLLNAGAKTRRNVLERLIGHIANDRSIISMISEPRTLQLACIHSIRRHLSRCYWPNTNLIGRIEALNLPQVLLDIISLQK